MMSVDDLTTSFEKKWFPQESINIVMVDDPKNTKVQRSCSPSICFFSPESPQKNDTNYFTPQKTSSLGKNLRGWCKKGRFMPKGSCVARGVGIVGEGKALKYGGKFRIGQMQPSLKLTHLPKRHFWVDDVPFFQVGSLSSLEGTPSPNTQGRRCFFVPLQHDWFVPKRNVCVAEGI